MVHRNHGKGTLMIDRHFAKVLGSGRQSRINLASGTNDQKLYDQIAYTMLDQFAERQPGLLEEIRDQKLHPLQAYRLWLSGEWLQYTGNANHARPLVATLEKWAKLKRKRLSAKTREARLGFLKQVTEYARAGATLKDLPAVMEQLREDCDDDDTASKFNHARSHARAFLRDTVKKSDRLYAAVVDVAPLEETPKIGRHPQTPDGARAIAERLGPKAGPIWLALCYTGMNLKEFFRDGWEVDYELGAVRIHGQKREARERLVPLLVAPPVPQLTRDGFKSALRRHKIGATPHDARRSYAVWLAAAGVDLIHRNYYRGHAAGSMEQLYTQPGESIELIRSWLDEDRPKLRTYLKLEEPGLRVASA